MNSTTKDEITRFLEDMMKAYSSGDTDKILNYFATDNFVGYGTGADEKYIGFDEIRAGYERDMSQSDGVTFSMGWSHVSVSKGGDVAWVACDVSVDATLPDGQSVHMPARMTAVLQKHDNGWLIEQSHLSVPSATQEEGQSF